MAYPRYFGVQILITDINNTIQVRELPPARVPVHSCFDTFLSRHKTGVATDDATGPVKGDGKKRPTLQFADPSWTAPDFLDFLGFAQIECSEAMSSDYNNMALIIQVWYINI